MGRPSKKTATATPAAPVPVELPAASPDSHEDQVRSAFELALLQQLQSSECSASWGDVARKYLADCATQRQWQAERADLEIQAQKDNAPQPVRRALPFPAAEEPRNDFEVE